MYLSRLEMVGFKSFAHKIDLSYTDGVTAIVGPNGCGKTNIVDAIRWVLGEQKTSMLRADNMEQVIFNGSKARKPLGMAEVSLTIENNRKILPTEYNQVVITRRLFRSGESQYLLNKTQCRLRDIVDLFMDTGMGAGAYSVIELKMIETILSDKADERRHLFEEAAGVTKYKTRRKEASRKLDAAQRDIARVHDIVLEVQKTVNSLARQASKAKRHQELTLALKALDKQLFAFEYAEEWAVLEQLKAQITAVREKKEASQSDLQNTEESVNTAERDHESAEDTLRALAEAENEIRTAAGEAKQQVSVLEERIASAKGAIQRLEQQHTESAEQRTTTEEQLVNVRERLESAKRELVASTERVDAAQEVVAGARTAVENARLTLGEHRSAEARARHEMNEHKSVVDRTHVQEEAINRRLTDNAQQTERIIERVAAVQQQVDETGEGLPELDARLAEAEKAQHEAEERRMDLQNQQEQLQSELDGLRSDVAHKSASLEFLAGLVDTTESSKFLMNTDEWRPSGDKLTLAEVLNATDDHRVAIEAALGNAARFFVVATKEEAAQAIGALSKHKVGKATFLCRDSIPSMPAPPSVNTAQGVIGWASELVQADDQLIGAVRAILGKTIVVNSINDAWDAIESTKADSAVSLEGEIVHRSGAIRGGSRSRTEGVRVGRRERIEQLTAEVESLKEKVSSTEQTLVQIKADLQSINLKALADEVRQAALARNDVQQRVDALKGRLEDIKGQQDALAQEAEGFRGEIEALGERRAEETRMAEESAALLSELEGKTAEFEQALGAKETELESATAKLREAEILMVRLDGEVQTLQSDEERLSHQGVTLEERQGQHKRESESLGDQLVKLEEELVGSRGQVELTSQQLAEASAKRQAQELTVRELSQATHAAMESVRKKRGSLDEVVNELHDLDIKVSSSQMRIDTLVTRATEDLEIEVPEEPQKPETDQNIPELKEEAQEIRRKLTSMGNVNFLALEEHERENERLEFLSKQLNDLTEAEKTLKETIAEINRTAREKFTTTFEAIRKNFAELFKLLFSEDDEADLQMIDGEDHDPLESKIEIIAKPRGKRPHSIEMLSGGEKTLTAIALLFSIYLVKPSPFCILDEVDAPLDDANIDRYLKLIRKFSENTQFLMITHNKKTMEAADTLYGVTMEETAVSKVVSVQLSGEDSASKAAAA